MFMEVYFALIFYWMSTSLAVLGARWLHARYRLTPITVPLIGVLLLVALLLVFGTIWTVFALREPWTAYAVLFLYFWILDATVRQPIPASRNAQQREAGMAENRVTVWLQLALLGGVLAHQAFTKPPINEPARPAAERGQDAQSWEDQKIVALLDWRREIDLFDRDFPAEERARYVGPLRFRWHSLMEYVREDPRYWRFSDRLGSLGLTNEFRRSATPVGCGRGTDTLATFENRLKRCREDVTFEILTAFISRDAIRGKIDTAEMMRLHDEVLRLPDAEQEARVDEYLQGN
jgi:hypothetical protein